MQAIGKGDGTTDCSFDRPQCRRECPGQKTNEVSFAAVRRVQLNKFRTNKRAGQ